MIARKLLVAGALSLGVGVTPAAASPAARTAPPAAPTPAPAAKEASPAQPPVDTRRVTGNVIFGMGKGSDDVCRIDELRQVPLADAEIDEENPDRCTVELPVQP